MTANMKGGGATVRLKAIILCLFSLFLIGSSVGTLDSHARSTTVTVGQPAAAATTYYCTQRLSDDFNRSDSTTLNNGWNEELGDASISSNQLACAAGSCIIRNSTTYSTITQYAKITIVSGGWPSVFTRLADGGPYYTHYCSSSYVNWNDTYTSASMTCANGDSWGVMTTGTGTSTVVSWWKNPSNNLPISGGAHCTDTSKPCWDSVGDVPDVQLTNDPATASDSGTYTGILIFTAGSLADNFYAGDCSD